ncbi:CoA pyrophosphatase [Priestia megaterium]|nr:CoA pyrophosphatase [Priestia megaterium]
MNTSDIIYRLSKREPTILGMDEFLQFGVLVPLVEKDNELHVLFEVRSQNLRRQPGEICFPGGRIEEGDSTPEQAAKRETAEELGILTEQIMNVQPLDYMVSQFGTIIYPYVGFLDEKLELRPNPSEVAEVFTVPLSFFKNNQPDVYNIHFKVEPEPTFPFDAIIGGENYNWQPRKMEEHFYYFEDRVIWGLTAKILHHLVDVLNQ